MRFPLKHIGIVRGFSKTHSGVDFGWHGDKNPPVYAIADGEVIYYKKQPLGGYTIRIKHFDEGNYISEYGHLLKGSIKVKVGQRIKMGDMIAQMGKSGVCSGEHLHLTIYKGKYSNKFNPLNFLCLYKEQEATEKTLKNYRIFKTKTVKGTDGFLAIRDKPSTDGKIIRKAKEGSQVESFGVKKGWNIVDNINGYYCSNKYLK